MSKEPEILATVFNEHSKQSKLKVAALFKIQLSEILEATRGSTVHFIRCVKASSTPGQWDSASVTQQLKDAAVHEMLTISSVAAFSMRDSTQIDGLRVLHI